MTVRKFRSVEEIPETWLAPGSRELFRAIAAVWAFGDRVLEPRFPPGVHRHRTALSLFALEEEWDARNFAALQLRRQG